MDRGVGQRLTGGMGRLRRRQQERSDQKFDDRFAERFAQWSSVRAERRQGAETPPSIHAGPTNFTRAQVPWALDLAAAWSWRFVIIVVAGYAVLWALSFFSVIVVPVVIALLIAALSIPMVDAFTRLGLPRSLSAILTVIGGIAFITLLLTFVGQQIMDGFSDLSGQVVDGIEEIRNWLRDGPLQASDSQINDYLQRAQELVTESNDEVVSRATEVTTAVGHILAGFFIVLFSTYFFLADGARIWAWVVRIFPRAARERADESGRVAWRSVTQFVRATVLVAAVDAIGIMIVAGVLGVPFVTAIGVLVFLGAFVPLIGATLSGTVAVLVALVAQGPLVALLMLGGVLLVQQIEAHVLQPFLMGRFVAIHPLGVIVAIAAGVLVAGIVGALFAVPLVAAVNAVVLHLASTSVVGQDPLDGSVEDEGVVGETEPDVP